MRMIDNIMSLRNFFYVFFMSYLESIAILNSLEVQKARKLKNVRNIAWASCHDFMTGM